MNEVVIVYSSGLLHWGPSQDYQVCFSSLGFKTGEAWLKSSARSEFWFQIGDLPLSARNLRDASDETGEQVETNTLSLGLL